MALPAKNLRKSNILWSTGVFMVSLRKISEDNSPCQDCLIPTQKLILQWLPVFGSKVPSGCSVPLGMPKSTFRWLTFYSLFSESRWYRSHMANKLTFQLAYLWVPLILTSKEGIWGWDGGKGEEQRVTSLKSINRWESLQRAVTRTEDINVWNLQRQEYQWLKENLIISQHC